MNSLVRKNKLMEEKFELEKELNRSVLTSIKSQLNPHFFYNALNTIQSFVYMDDRKNASNYLGRFSKLTRTILEMSEKETISLKEEIEALTLYLELEKMRFEDSFSFEINYQGVDAELENIPPMLIQPYVENAVKHGLLHKKGNKTLKLTFKKNGNFITVSVDDNGIGRKKSSEINKLKNPDHKSFAMAANEKHLRLLSSEKNSSLMIQFIDKMNDDDTPAGTTVLLQIPTSLN